MSRHQRPFEPSEALRFSDAFERAHGHEDNPHVGLADSVFVAKCEDGTVYELEITSWGVDEDSGDTIVTFQAVRP